MAEHGKADNDSMSEVAAVGGSGRDDEAERQRRQSELEARLEVKSLRRIISAYLNYADAAEQDVRRYEKSYRKLPSEHKALLSHLPLKFKKLRRCISVNTYFIMNMLQVFEPPLDMSQYIAFDGDENICGGVGDCSGADIASDCAKGLDHELHACTSEDHSSPEIQPPSCKEASNINTQSSRRSYSNEIKCACDWLDPALQLNVPLVDVDKVRCIIRNIVRDWAPEGEKERDQCYKPILEELDRLFPSRSKERPPTCLVPGAGLGRLALDISCHGFVSQGNEFSYYMMICSSFILNHTRTSGEWIIYPWIHSNCNSFSDNDQLRAVSFPDIHPADAGITEGFSMCGGDFVEVYGDKSQEASWDAVVTCFFLDTAHNIVEYIEIISKILKNGGVWINLGPLLYHFADVYGTEDEISIEISLEDVKKVASHYGLEMEMEKIIETTYTANPRSMMQNRYLAAFWTMKKK